jgi:hypothetical protein
MRATQCVGNHRVVREARREAPVGLRIYIIFIYVIATALMLLVFGEGLAHEQWSIAAIGFIFAAYFGRRTVASVRAIRQAAAGPPDPDSFQRRSRRGFWVVLGSSGLALAGMLIGRAPLWMTVGLTAYMVALALFMRWSTDRVATRLGEEAQAVSE